MSSQHPDSGYLGGPISSSSRLIHLLLFLATVLFLFVLPVEASSLAFFSQKPPLKLIPELTIGYDGLDENLIFGRVAYLDVDSLGNVYILDSKLRQLKIFNQEGQLVASFGEVFEVPKNFEPMKMMPMFGATVIFSCAKDGLILVLNPHSYEFLIFRNRSLKATV